MEICFQTTNPNKHVQQVYDEEMISVCFSEYDIADILKEGCCIILVVLVACCCQPWFKAYLEPGKIIKWYRELSVLGCVSPCQRGCILKGIAYIKRIYILSGQLVRVYIISTYCLHTRKKTLLSCESHKFAVCWFMYSAEGNMPKSVCMSYRHKICIQYIWLYTGCIYKCQSSFDLLGRR